MAQSQFTNLRNFNYYDFLSHLDDHTIAEYIWIDGTGKNLRSKTKVYERKLTKLEEFEWWTYDGSSCNQATTGDSEIWLKPVFFCVDPFRKGVTAYLVLCETYLSDKQNPAKGNFRYIAEKVMNEAKHEDPWFGIEQEYFLFSRTGTTHAWPLGWPDGGYPFPQGRYYCSVGDFNCFGRAITEAHIRCCLAAGIKIAGINAEVAPSQWEYQIGITKGIQCGDHMWMSRYILLRLGEEMGAHVVFEPKPIKGDWNGSGAHTNYSTNSTRAEGGLDFILQNHLPKLREKHLEHITVYGEGNKHRLTGSYETSSIHTFSYGLGSRSCSVRIPVYTADLKRGYYEDRRPASNIDPYLVSAILVDTTVLDSRYCDTIVAAYKKFRKEQGGEEESSC
ncbi:glutamine synthetase (macronuclear) [Tetrahymena thermophila SB210]|uniref:Glutamine synthetase n=1 Tax=Tetrahymena thermophila (strain SB210) TaxID=312017 RepID=Q22BV6_TETTS|nr:glutamine synthetase [Tetrahymena thermophila SB210]EAR82744.1 glutamine synthetase [Tetrahymena thermophila SB210]|eukprot:XP_001030407.1 glutamine synthetase [Tetrahymena thermophila SB210]